MHTQPTSRLTDASMSTAFRIDRRLVAQRLRAFASALLPYICSAALLAFLMLSGYLLVLRPLNAFAKPPLPNLKAEVDARHLAEVKATLQKNSPNTRIDSVQFSPIEGLYEVVMGRNVAYTDASGRFALFGHIWDMQASRDITADRKSLLDRVDVATLDRSLALKHVRGNGTREVFVFADPQCGFCKQQEQALLAMDDLTVYTFVLPVLGAESRRIAAGVLCAADPAAAWSGWMLRGERPAAASQGCRASTEGVEQLARGLGINSTPTLVASDGRKSAGAMGLTQLGAWLSPVQPGQQGQATAVTSTVAQPVPAAGVNAAVR